MKILKKYANGGQTSTTDNTTDKKKASEDKKLLTDRQVWDSNKDNVQDKYDSFSDYQKAAGKWRAEHGKYTPTTGTDDKPNEKGISMKDLRREQRHERKALRKNLRGGNKNILARFKKKKKSQKDN